MCTCIWRKRCIQLIGVLFRGCDCTIMNKQSCAWKDAIGLELLWNFGVHISHANFKPPAKVKKPKLAQHLQRKGLCGDMSPWCLCRPVQLDDAKLVLYKDVGVGR